MKIEQVGKILTFWTTDELKTFYRYEGGGWAMLNADNKTLTIMTLEENNELEATYWEWQASINKKWEL